MVLTYPYSPYCGAPPDPGTLASRWNLDPVLIGCLALAFVAYLVMSSKSAPASRWRRLCFIGGYALTVLALISPLCALSVSLFAARIGQHMILETVAAPLVALGLPTPRGGPRRALYSAGAFAVMLAFWHAPQPYDATFESTFIYWTMHLTLFGSALWFWREALGAPPRRAAVTLAATLGVSLTMALVGAVIVFAPEPLYSPHLLTTWIWGLSPLTDQQLGGVIMWVPAGLIFVVALMATLARVLNHEPSGIGISAPA